MDEILRYFITTGFRQILEHIYCYLQYKKFCRLNANFNVFVRTKFKNALKSMDKEVILCWKSLENQCQISVPNPA